MYLITTGFVTTVKIVDEMYIGCYLNTCVLFRQRLKTHPLHNIHVNTLN